MHHPQIPFPGHHHVVHGHILVPAVYRPPHHHPFLNIRPSCKQLVQSLPKLGQLHLRQIAQGSHIDAQKWNILYAQLPGRPDQRSVAAQHQGTVHPLRHGARDNMAFLILFGQDTAFSMFFYVISDFLCDPEILIL